MTAPKTRPGVLADGEAADTPGRPSPAGGDLTLGGAPPVGPIVITAYGSPGPQGSKRHMGRGIMVESSKKVKPWREAVKAAALARGLNPVITGPVTLEITFTLTRPKYHYGTGRNALRLRDRAPTYPTSPPDLSKIVRSTEDAITDVGIWRSDAQAVIEVTRKVYPGTHPDALDRPGAVIRITPLGGTG